MTVSLTYNTSVKVYDTDFQQVAHYASYYRFYTDAITYFSKQVFGDSLETLAFRGTWFVVAESYSRYHRPLRLGDEISVKVSAELLGDKAIKYGFEIMKGGQLTTEGHLVMVCIDPSTWRATSMPQDIVEKFREAEAAQGKG